MLSLAEQQHGILRPSDAAADGISKAAFNDFVRDHKYERVSHGIYCDPEVWVDQLCILQLRCPRTVYSHDTALFLHDLTDQEPMHYSVTARTGYNPSHLTKDGIRVYTVKEGLFTLGLSSCTTPFGNTVSVYNMERTICDIILSRSSMEPQILQDALKRYSRRRDKKLHQLMDYADRFHISRILRQYMEVLL